MNDDDPSDALYDAYLDACLAGTAEDPATFCARHGLAAPGLRARFDSLFAQAKGRTARPGPPTAAVPAEGLAAGSATGPTTDSPADAAAPSLPFERLGEFRLLRALDRGGMGAVYLARQESLGRDVALKVLRPELSGSADAATRFRREARALARLRHPNIVAVHAVGEDHGVQYLAMELVPGRSLDAIVAGASARGATLPAAQSIAWARDLARALAHAHGEGVVHRDVKPSNIRITDDGRPLLLDFGIAKDAAGEGPALTRTFAGSPLYAAPEQLAGAPADHRVDVYGLGVVLYQCMTGRVPFAGGSMEQVLGRVLVEDALPPRRLNPAVPRDAETVVLHALEKDADRRYATASAFADDLDAVLASRPVSVRAPGAADRFRKWCRRRPVPAAVAATLVAGAIVGGALFVSGQRADAADRRSRAATTVTAARERLGAYHRARESAATLDREVADFRASLANRHLTAVEDAARDAKEDAAAAARRGRETSFFEVLDLLRAAEVLDPDTPGAEDVRAELFRERWREARAARDDEGVRFYRGLVAMHDAAGRFTSELAGTASFDVRSDPPGATVHLFAVRELAEVVPGGEHRLVPVPPDGTTWPIAPGTPSLRVVRGAGDIAPDDLVVAVAGRPVADAFLVVETLGDATRVRRLDRLVAADGVAVRSLSDLRDAQSLRGGDHAFTFERGGQTFETRAMSLAAAGVVVADAEAVAAAGDVEATIVQGGVLRDVVLPRGLGLRRTDAPVVLTHASVVGRTPLARIERAEGHHLVVLDVPDRPRARVPLLVQSDGTSSIDVRMPAPGAAPDGFVYVPEAGEADCDVWWMDREVTCAEYLEFLNDPAVRARIAASAEPVLFPRTPDDRRDGGSWTRDAAGRFALRAPWRPDWPVLGISWNDARDFAAWRTARAAAAGRGDIYRLPTFREWVAAVGGSAGRTYSYGNRFHARWVKSCFARPHASPEPVRSYPVDESPYGVFDLTGSAYEWVDGWWDESRAQRRLAGGSWAQGEVGRFEVWGGTGAPAPATAEDYGFRLVLVRPEDAR